VVPARKPVLSPAQQANPAKILSHSLTLEFKAREGAFLRTLCAMEPKTMAKREAIVVVGNGMAGARFVQALTEKASDRFTITVFGDEPYGNYNRILLSSVLAGVKQPVEIFLNPTEWYEKNGIRLHLGVRVVRIDRDRRVAVGQPARHGDAEAGRGLLLEEPYDYLVLATGSRPFVPTIPGKDLPGVFVFRTLDDCVALLEAAERAECAVVIGGGLLGLEAARGLHGRGLKVSVVEIAPHLMVQQLDPLAGRILQQQLEKLGLRIFVQTQVSRILGEGRVQAVELQDGTLLDADLVVISCGIRPNVELAREAGLAVQRGIVVDDQLRTSDPAIFAIGECAEHRGVTYGLVEPVYEQAEVLADVLSGVRPHACYAGSKLATTLKVIGIDLTSMGDVKSSDADSQVFVEADPPNGRYRKLVVKDGRLQGAILLGEKESAQKLLLYFRSGEKLPGHPLEIWYRFSRDGESSEDGQQDAGLSAASLPDDQQICNCHRVSKREIVRCIRAGATSIEAIGQACKAGTGCGSCQGMLGHLLAHYARHAVQQSGALGDTSQNKVELIKREKDGLDSLPDILRYARTGNWEEMTEADKQRFKWHGLFFRIPTPGYFMLRIRHTCGQSNARQFRVIAELSDKFGKGFCDLTTRQQIQMRWFTIRDVPEIWARLAEVGLNSKQTGMDNVRGVCGCPLSGLAPHELFDASPVAREFTSLILDNKEFTNLPRKFNVTITGCLENCCHTETQDIALVPSYRELDGQQVFGFNVFVGGKQGSGGYTPAKPLDVFVRREEAARLCAEIVRIFRDHGSRESRTRARLAFLLQDRGVRWFRQELQARWGKPLFSAGPELRKKHHTDHLGIQPQKRKPGDYGPQLFSVGLLVPVGRITTDQMRGVADLAERYGNGEIRLTVQQNIIIPNIPEDRLSALTDEPLLKELPIDPSPILRGLVCCTGNDYCHFALIDTKGWALQVARELERRTQGQKIAPLTIHMSGCPAGCGLHQVATIGLQGCRTRIGDQIVDAAHVYINGKSGPQPQIATDAMYDVPCEKLADALEPLVRYLPRS
jgi:ferredoxin-nitrite reductase